MNNLLRRIPWVQLLWPTVIIMFVYFYNLNIRAAIREELASYVSRNEFNAWVLAHRQWSDEVLRRIEGNISDAKDSSRENNEMLKQLISRPPPQRQSQQKP